MSPVMVAPLVVLAALLVVPGRLPAQRGVEVATERPTSVSHRASSAPADAIADGVRRVTRLVGDAAVDFLRHAP